MSLKKEEKKMKIKMLIVLLIALALEGCVGIGVVHSKESIKECSNEDSKQKNLEWLEKTYGKAELKEKNNQTEYVFVKDSTAFRGVIPMLFIGIPLVLPLGTDYYSVTYEGDKCIGVQSEYTNWSGYMCGILNENGRMGCSSLGR